MLSSTVKASKLKSVLSSFVTTGNEKIIFNVVGDTMPAIVNHGILKCFQKEPVKVVNRAGSL